MPAIAREDAIKIRVQRAVGNTLPRSYGFAGLFGSVKGKVLMARSSFWSQPTEPAYWNHRDHRRGELPLHAEAEIRSPGRRVVVCQIGQS